MKKDYTTYGVVDFLKDEDFLRWRLSRLEEDEIFWNSWLQGHPEKQNEIEEAMRLFSSLKKNNERFSEEEKKEMLDNIHARARKRNRKLRLYYGAAAACIALLVVAIFFKPEFFEKKEPQVLLQIQETDLSREIQLILSDEEILNLQDNADITYSSEGEVYIHSSTGQASPMKVEQEKSKWNKLIVPKGKQSSLCLSDGSKVWVNAGTTLEFPVTFDATQRDLFVNGEIYIQVARDEQKPFYVKTRRFTVNVLGTRFNISAYAEDEQQFVILEEGSVEVSPALSSLQKVQLRPDQMLRIGQSSYNIETVNVYDYTSWKDGLFRFRSESLPSVLSRLERYYGVPIEYDSSVLSTKCTGKLILFDDIEEVLRVITKSIPVKTEKKDGRFFVTKIEKN